MAWSITCVDKHSARTIDKIKSTHILEIGLRIALLGMNENGKLGRVAQEEDGSIVKDPIPIALFRIKLDRETSRITCRIRGTLLPTHGGEARNTLGLFAHAIEHIQRRLSHIRLLLSWRYVDDRTY